MHFATYAAQMLDSAAGTSLPTAPPPQHQNQQVTPATALQGYSRSSPKQRDAEQIKQHQSPRSQANGASPSLQNSSMSVKRPVRDFSFIPAFSRCPILSRCSFRLNFLYVGCGCRTSLFCPTIAAPHTFFIYHSYFDIIRLRFHLLRTELFREHTS